MFLLVLGRRLREIFDRQQVSSSVLCSSVQQNVNQEKQDEVAQLVALRSTFIEQVEEDGVKRLETMVGIGRKIVVLMKYLAVVSVPVLSSAL